MAQLRFARKDRGISILKRSLSAVVDASLNQQLTLAAVGMSGAALFFSLLAVFPGLKGVLAAVRDGVLWFALFVVIGAGGFMVWQNAQPSQQPVSAANGSRGLVAADPSPQIAP
jgi:hypothetical protein